MKKLAIGITCYPSVGGSGIVASQLGSELARLGHQIHFISYEPPFRLDLRQPNVRFHGVTINEYQLFKYPDYTLPLAVKMAEVARKEKLDVLHVHYAVPHATAALLATRIALRNKQKAPKVITTLHGTDISLLGRDASLRAVIKYSIEESDGVTAVSESLRRETIGVLRTRKPIEVIHNFYRPRTPTKSRRGVRAALGLGDDDFVVAHLSNLRPVKRIPDLLRVLSHLKDMPRIKFLILAGGSFDEFRPLARKLRVEDRIVICQSVLDIENYLNASDAGLYGSEKESFGMGVLETMSFGKPVVATRLGGVPEIVIDRETGFLEKLGDVRAMAADLRRLAEDPMFAERIGTRAQKRAKEEFSPGRRVAHYVEYYRRVLADRPDRHTG
jgi:N-acetyl-alpha-D-glucosaminyl L-malate synthase BshA